MRAFIKAAFSDNGTPSSARILMGVFSVFTMGLLAKIIDHLLDLSIGNNQGMLIIWLTNLPLIIVALCGLIGLPYSVSRGASAISDLANLASSMRHRQDQDRPNP